MNRTVKVVLSASLAISACAAPAFAATPSVFSTPTTVAMARYTIAKPVIKPLVVETGAKVRMESLGGIGKCTGNCPSGAKHEDGSETLKSAAARR